MMNIPEHNQVSDLKILENFESRRTLLEKSDFSMTGNLTVNNGITLLNQAGTDYLKFNRITHFPKEISIYYRLIVHSTAGACRILGSSVNDSSITNRTYLDSGTKRMYIYMYIGSSLLGSSYMDITSYIGTTTEIDLLWVVRYASGTSYLDSYLNGQLQGTVNQAGNLGLMADLNIGWWRVSNSGADATIKRFMFFNRALTARDAEVLYSDSLFQDIQPEKNVFIVKGDSSYNDGANQVTNCLGSAISKAIMGDGSTPSTFPVLSSTKREHYYDGGDSINCGSLSASNFLLNTPFSLGAIISNRTFVANQTIIGKYSSPNGWALYFPNSDRCRFLFRSGASLLGVETSLGGLPLHGIYSIILTHNGAGSISTTNTKIYVNGMENTLLYGAGTNVPDYTGINTLIGSGVGYFTGNIGLPTIANTHRSKLQVEILDGWMKSLWRNK